MMLEALIAYLSSLGKVYTARARQNIRPPFYVLNLISEVPDQDELCGSGATQYEIQLDAYAFDHLAAGTMTGEAYTLLNRPGEWFDLGDYTVGNMRVTSVEDTTELEYQGSASALVRKTITAQIHAQKG